MSTQSTGDLLVNIPWFRRVSRDEINRVAPSFVPQRLQPGEVLWKQGEAVSELGILVAGELMASVNGKEVGRVRSPDLVGEASAFFAGTVRSATLQASNPALVLALTTPDLRALRFQRSDVYACLLDQALRVLVRRVASTSREIAKHATGGTLQPSRKEPGVLARLWRSLRPGGPTEPPMALEPLLRRMPGMHDLDPEVERQVVGAFTAQPFAEGEILVLEGEPSNAMWVLADGEVDVLRNVRGDKAELLTKLRTGQQFGANTMIEMGPRSASCVAVSAGWAYRMDRTAWDGLRGDAATRWRECVLATLASQIRNANGALARALAGAEPAAPPTRPGATTGRPASPGLRAPSPGGKERVAATHTDNFDELLRASGFLESLPTEEAELESLTFEVDDASKRRTR